MTALLICVILIGILWVSIPEKKEIPKHLDSTKCTGCGNHKAEYLWYDGCHLCYECDEKKMGD